MNTIEKHFLLDDNDRLILFYNNFSLEWRSNKEITFFRLNRTTHNDVLKWISETYNIFLNKEYKYNFHNDLPYSINDSSTLKVLDVEKLNELLHLRILTQFVLERVVSLYKLNTIFRTWSHHFDTNMYCVIPESGISIRLDLAIQNTSIQ